MGLTSCSLLTTVTDTMKNGTPSTSALLPTGAVPENLYARAQAFLDEVRFSEGAPGWEEAQLSGEVQPFYRPDLDGVAYYEFAVEPRGFVLLSTGPHDFPVAHWDPFGKPISRVLAEEANQTPLRFYKLDTLYYAAENAEGERVAGVGTPVVKVSGMSMDMLDASGVDLSSVIVHPATEVPDDSQIDGVDFVEERSGPENTPVTLDAWESWQALKEGYTDSYSVFLEDLRRRAQLAWDDDAEHTLATEGTPVAARHLRSRWSFHWAGSFKDQRDYKQYELPLQAGFIRCPSGCGATAWAMLFGWADHQAENGNSYWAGRWGLYRKNGGYGSNADAPRKGDAGVKRMTLEIRNDVGSFCAFGQGITHPGGMPGAKNYFKNRTGTSMEVHSNWLGIHAASLQKRVVNSIVQRKTPAIIGTGWLSHYPLALGFASRCNANRCQSWFYVNEGWGGDGNGWVSAGTWFSGEIFP